MCSSSSTATPRQVEVRHTKFTIAGIPGEKHAVFVPDGLKLTPAVFAQICGALGQEPPSAFLCGLGCLCHPARLTTRPLRRCAGCRQLMEEARCSLGLAPVEEEDQTGLFGACTPRRAERPQRSRDELTPDDPEAGGRCLTDVANRVLERKAASAVASILAAAARTKAWVLSGPQISSFEVLLQQCADERAVPRLVVGHLQDRAYMEAEASRQLLKRLFGASKPMSARSVQRASALALQGDIWDPGRNGSHPEFGRYGFDYWSFLTYEDKRAQEHPVTQWPWPHGDVFILFYHEDARASAGHPNVDWAFSTRSRNDLEAVPFDAETLAPVAHVAIGGGEPGAKRRLFQVMKSLRPVIILDNTPSVPKQVGTLLEAIHRVWLPAPLTACRPFLAEGRMAAFWGSLSAVDLLQALAPGKLLQHVEGEFDCRGMEEAERLNLGDVVDLLDLAKRRPQAFRGALRVLDPLRCSADEAAAHAMAVLGPRPDAPGARELCGGSESHRSVVLKAWRLHRKLALEAARLRRLATLLMFSTASAMTLAMLLAVATVSLHLQKGDFEEIDYHFSAFLLHRKLELAYTWSEANWTLGSLLLLLPLLLGSLLLAQAHFRFAQRWAAVHLLASTLVSELHHFLASSGPYAAPPPKSRELLECLLRDLTMQLALHGPEDRAPGSAEPGEVDPRCAEADFPRDAWALEEHVDQHLYGIRPAWCCGRRGGDGCPTSVRSFACHAAPPELRDFTRALSAESYVELRIVPLRRFCAARARGLARLRGALQSLSVLCLGVASALAAGGAFVWVPAPGALSALLAACGQWWAPAELLAAVSGALAVLDGLDLRWHGADVRENRSEASRRRLVTSAERAALAVAAATCAGVGAVLLEPRGPCDAGAGLATDEAQAEDPWASLAPSGERSQPLPRSPAMSRDTPQ